MPQDKLTKKIDSLAHAIEKLIAMPVAPVAPVLPIAPTHSGDHDLLLTFRSETQEQMKAIRVDIKELKDGTSATIADHETRIRTMEKAVESFASDFTTIKKIVYGAVSFILITVLSSVVYLVINNN